MLICKICGGRVFLEKEYMGKEESRWLSLETSCVKCGDRKYVPSGNRFGKWLREIEEQKEGFRNGQPLSTSSLTTNSTRN